MSTAVYAYTRAFANETGASMHLALAREGELPKPLNHGFGVLFPKCDFFDGSMDGKSKGLANPWLFRMKQGTFGVAALRRDFGKAGETAVEEDKGNSVLFFESPDLLHYTELGLRAIAPESETIEDVRCEFDGNAYRLCLLSGGKWLVYSSHDLVSFAALNMPAEIQDRVKIDIWDALPACSLTLTEEESNRLARRLTPPTAPAGSKVFSFPLMPCRGDPMAIFFKGRYYFMATDDEHGQLSLKIRVADELADIPSAPDHVLLKANPDGDYSGCFWAPELLVVGGRLCLFFAAGMPHWYTVQSRVMVLHGDDPTDSNCWSAPKRCEKADGSVLTDSGITLDMTVLDTKNGYYAVWSQRPVVVEPFALGTADLLIAKLSPEKPWRLSSEPKTLCRPEYGWERIGTPVNEGAFCLRRGGKLYVTYAAALIDHTYCVGMLSATDGDDLLDMTNWEKSNYPVLHRFSVPGLIGAGHNSFVKDWDGTDIMMIHAIPMENYLHDPRDWRRYPSFRPVVWDEEGYPHLDA